MTSESSDDYFPDTTLDFHSELFPEIHENDYGQENVSNGVSGSDSDDSSSFIDVGEPEHVLSTHKSSEADQELVSYLTGNNNPESKTANVRIVRVVNRQLSQEHSKPLNVNRGARVLKIDSAGNRRMLQTIRVVNRVESTNINDSKTGVEDDYSDFLNHPSLSKSAIAARENREKKKKYVSDLERAVTDLSVENKALKSQNENYLSVTENLKREVRYLKSVLMNQSTLSKLLNNIPGIPEIAWSSKQIPMKHTKRKPSVELEADEDQILFPPAKRTKSQSNITFDTQNADYLSDMKGSDGGVCLHVSGSAVSLEFCARCNENATSAKV